MSEEEQINQAAELLRTKWLGPSGHLHPAAGYIEKREQVFLSRLKALGFLVEKGTQAINDIENYHDNPTDAQPVDTIDDVLGRMIGQYADWFNSYSGGIKGIRSKQFSKIGSSVRAGATVEEPKRSLFDKLRGKNKESEIH